MQLKIFKRLNAILYFMLGAVLVFIIFMLVKFGFHWPFMWEIFVAIFIYNIICFFIYKTLEKNWDKSIIQKMAINNQIAIANIKKSALAFPFKDSSGNHYNMWQIEIEYVDQDYNHHQTVIFEKMNHAVNLIPLGTIFVTHDPKRPERKLIVPNVIISHIETLMPIVQNYEKSKKSFIKYLNVYYNFGIVIETYRQSMQKEEQ